MERSGWTTLRLGDVCIKIGSGATPRGGSEVYSDDGPFVLVRSQNVYNDGFHQEGLVHISPQQAEELRNVEVLGGDVLLNITGDSVARCCQIDERVLPARVNQHVSIIRPDPQKLDAQLLRYWLIAPDVQALLLSWAGAGGTRNALTKAMIESFEVAVPSDVKDQRAIASVLGAFDSRIELNQRMNETLGGVFRALFKSWFLDYDPVHTKSADRDSGLPKTFADLFPDSFGESELGELPKGWTVGTLDEVAENPRRGVQPYSISKSTPYIGLEHMPRRSISLSEWAHSDGLASGKFEFKSGEFLFGKLRPYFHKIGVAPLDGVCSTDILVVTPKEPDWYGFVLGHISSDPFVDYTNAGSTGTKMPRTSWQEMSRYPFAKPPATVARQFSKFVRPLVQRIVVGIHQSRTLARLRNALLPKLISGELRVREAERIAGESM